MFHGKVSPEIAAGLTALRERIAAANIPSSKLDQTLNLATWNIRAFGEKRRSEPAIHYIAEILGQFDVISLVELRDDLSDLAAVMKILGPYWRAVYSDMIPDPGGNRERIAFIYDKRAATFTGLAAAVNPPRKKSGTEYVPQFGWWRVPYMASFSAGNFDFIIITAHIQWGTREGRQKELEQFATWVELKSQQANLEDKDIIVTGDFNIENNKMMDTLLTKGLMMPESLKKKTFGSTLGNDKRYDQILHLSRYPGSFMNKAGILDFYQGSVAPLFPGMPLTNFTFQISDHFPLWVQINTDNDDFQLEQIIRPRS